MAQASSSSAPAAAERDEHGIAFFDVETSVLPAGRCVLLEFGAVVVCPRTLVEVSSFSTFVRPADPDAAVLATTARCNGITRDAIATAPPFRDVADIIYGILHGLVWAGHNIMKFDSMIIWEAFAEIGRAPPQPKGMIDTLPLLTQQFGRRAGDMKMASLANYFGLGRQKHRSLDDVRMNIDVLKYCATVLFLEASPPLEVLKPDEAYFPGELVVSHGEEMMLETALQIDAGPSGYSEFFEPDNVSTECIKITVALLHQFGPRTVIQHKGAPLQLYCAGLSVRFGVGSRYPDRAGRPKLNIVVDIPENLTKVLSFCDDLAKRSSPEACNNSEWTPLIKRYGSHPTIRLKIPTNGNGDTTAYATDMYQKGRDGVISKIEVDVPELDSLFQGNKVDAFFSLEIFDYPQKAGIRLVAKRLDLHFKQWHQI
ncbi:unnamed protein product [Urochloa decumbens]|uniref:Exonuclease domain-containing protein n=1 Tax=Urochloa decumbens TaxID=240449 RepID=A0ABC8XAT8_9POAL